MATLREWVSRLWGTLRGNRADQDLDAEIRGHLELAAEDPRLHARSPEGAARAARLHVGGVAQTMEALRDQRGLPWLEDLARDLRYACRMLARNPGFTIVSVVSLAIGIGANCAVFTFADTLLLRPLTIPRPGEFLIVGTADPLRQALVASYREFLDVRDRSKSFEGLTAFTGYSVAFAVEPGAAPKPSRGMLVSSNFFQVVGVAPQLGRDFRPEEDQVPGRDAVVILGHEMWERQFGADRSVLGRRVRLNGVEFTVIGVAPAGFAGVEQYVRNQFYAPLMMWPRVTANPSVQPLEARDYRALNIGGRLASGVEMSQAQTELAVIAADLERAYPDSNRNSRIVARTEVQNRMAQNTPVVALLAMLTLLAGAVLFVACANVAGLLASRAPVRAREIALRMAIGAGRRRVIRQLMTESLLIALIGGTLGLGVGYAAVALFSRIQIPTDLPLVLAFEMDRRALLVSLFVALLSVVLFALAPAIRATRTDLTAVMKAADAAGFGRGRQWGRAVLVTGQVAVSVVLLVIATFMYRGFQQQLVSGPGFRTDRLLMLSVDPGQLGYSEEQGQRFFERLAERARLVPGVKSAALTHVVPLHGIPASVTLVPEGFQFPPGKESATHASAIVGEHYFETIDVPILKGREFRASDSADAPKVAVVNEVIAQRYWPGQDPVGKRFRVGSSRGPWVQIVGLAKTSKYNFIVEPPTDFLYFPYRQRSEQSLILLAQSVGDPSSLAAPLRDVVRRLDANLPVSDVRTMAELYRLRAVVVMDVVIALIGAMGTMGLGLALAGLYGLVAYAASRRTKEIGIRMAIGADRSDVLRMVLGQGVGLAVAGLGVGLLASLGAGHAMAAVFPGNARGGRIDFIAFVSVAAAVLAVTLVAAYIPARRASCVSPTVALRCE